MRFGYMTRAQLDAAGVTYDTAIPQDLFNQIVDANGGDTSKPGRNPYGQIVTVYQTDLGFLQAVTVEGANMLYFWNEKYPPGSAG